MPSDADYAAMAYGRGNRDPKVVKLVKEEIKREQDENKKPPIITAKHWLPDQIQDWDSNGYLQKSFLCHLAANGILPDDIQEPLETDPADPMPVKVFSSSWIHGDCHDIMTQEIFENDRNETIKKLAADVAAEWPVRFVRIYKESRPAWGVGFFDFRRPEFNFDLRAVVQFGTWKFRTDDGDDVTAAGFKFHIATLVEPTPDDCDVYVGRDWGAIFDGDDG